MQIYLEPSPHVPPPSEPPTKTVTQKVRSTEVVVVTKTAIEEVSEEPSRPTSSFLVLLCLHRPQMILKTIPILCFLITQLPPAPCLPCESTTISSSFLVLPQSSPTDHGHRHLSKTPLADEGTGESTD